ncbi:MAG: hypothetical protein WBZ42_03630 [Halobacteriota archaeon]
MAAKTKPPSFVAGKKTKEKVDPMTIESRIEMLSNVYYVFKEMAEADAPIPNTRCVLQEAFIALCEHNEIPVLMMIREVYETFNEHGWITGWMIGERKDFKEVME